MPYMNIRDEIAYESFKEKESRVKYYNVVDAFTNRGFMEGQDGAVTRFSLKDLVTAEDLMRFIPQTIETVVREALEPNLFIIDRLFQKVTIERGSRVQIGAIGQMEAGRVGQAGEYPERMIDMSTTGDMIAITTDKYGLKISLTEEVLQENQFDVINIWLRAAGRALARCKERAAAKLINEMGYKVLDNVTPSTSYAGVCTGRDITGTQNGSMTSSDVFELYAYLLNRGFAPDVLMMHPLAWKTFMTDVEMREVVLQASTIAQVRGAMAPNWGTSHNGYGLRTTGTGVEQTSGNTIKGPSAWTQTLNPLGAQFGMAPSYLPSPLQVIVTHYIPFSYGAQGIERMDTGCVCNVIMADSNNCGVIGQSEPVRTDKWIDPERDITNIKMREAWGLAVLEQGKAIAKASNVVIARNYNFENANSQVLTTLGLSGAISGLTIDLE